MASDKIKYTINNYEPFLLTTEARLIVIEHFKKNMPNYLLVEDNISKSGYMELSFFHNSVELSIQYSRAYLEFSVVKKKNKIDVLIIDSNLKEIKFYTPSNLAYVMNFFEINYP